MASRTPILIKPNNLNNKKSGKNNGSLQTSFKNNVFLKNNLVCLSKTFTIKDSERTLKSTKRTTGNVLNRPVVQTTTNNYRSQKSTTKTTAKICIDADSTFKGHRSTINNVTDRKVDCKTIAKNPNLQLWCTVAPMGQLVFKKVQNSFRVTDRISNDSDIHNNTIDAKSDYEAKLFALRQRAMAFSAVYDKCQSLKMKIFNDRGNNKNVTISNLCCSNIWLNAVHKVGETKTNDVINKNWLKFISEKSQLNFIGLSARKLILFTYFFSFVTFVHIWSKLYT